MRNRFFISVITLIFIVSQTVFADISLEKRNHRANDFSFLTHISLPSQLGHIRTVFQGESKKCIIHIQDSHCNFYAQKNISGILELYQKLLHEKGFTKPLTIFVEGAAGPVDTSFFGSFPIEEVKRDVFLDAMRRGIVTGPEYFTIMQAAPGISSLFGIENPLLYIENFFEFRNAMFSDEIKKYLQILVDEITSLKKEVYSPQLFAFDQATKKYQEGILGIEPYLAYLARIIDFTLEEYRNIRILQRSLEESKRIEPVVLEEERLEIFSLLEKSLSREQISQLLRKSLEYRLGRITDYDFYDYLASLLKTNQLPLDRFIQTKLFLRFLKIRSQLNFFDVMKEIEVVQEKAFEDLLRTPEEKHVAAIYSQVVLFEKLFQLHFSRKDLATFNRLDATRKFSDLITKIEKVLTEYNRTIPYELMDEKILSLGDTKAACGREFYRIALERDEVLVKNTLEKMNKENIPVAILVAGGFHSDGITAKLKEKNISHLVVVPAIPEESREGDAIYLSLMLDKRIYKRDGFSFPRDNHSFQALAYLSMFSNLMGVLAPVVQIARTENLLNLLIDHFLVYARDLSLDPLEVLTEWNEHRRIDKIISPQKQGIEQRLTKIVQQRIETLSEQEVPLQPLTHEQIDQLMRLGRPVAEGTRMYLQSFGGSIDPDLLIYSRNLFERLYNQKTHTSKEQVFLAVNYRNTSSLLKQEIQKALVEKETVFLHTVTGRYRVLEVIDSGLGGSIYKVRRIAEDGKEKPVTILKPFNGASAEAAADTLLSFFTKTLQSDSIANSFCANVLDYDYVSRFVESEYIEGKTFDQLVFRKDKLSAFRSLVKNLAYLHRKYKAFHDDLYPSNIIITDEGKAVLIDWDHLKILHSTSSSIEEVMSLVKYREIYFAGSMLAGIFGFAPQYMPDIFANGNAFSTEPVDIRQHRGKVTFGLPSRVPAGFGDIIKKAMLANPHEHYESLDEMLIDLDAVLGAIPASASERKPYGFDDLKELFSGKKITAKDGQTYTVLARRPRLRPNSLEVHLKRGSDGKETDYPAIMVLGRVSDDPGLSLFTLSVKLNKLQFGNDKEVTDLSGKGLGLQLFALLQGMPADTGFYGGVENVPSRKMLFDDYYVHPDRTVRQKEDDAIIVDKPDYACEPNEISLVSVLAKTLMGKLAAKAGFKSIELETELVSVELSGIDALRWLLENPHIDGDKTRTFGLTVIQREMPYFSYTENVPAEVKEAIAKNIHFLVDAFASMGIKDLHKQEILVDNVGKGEEKLVFSITLPRIKKTVAVKIGREDRFFYAGQIGPYQKLVNEKDPLLYPALLVVGPEMIIEEMVEGTDYATLFDAEENPQKKKQLVKEFLNVWLRLWDNMDGNISLDPKMRNVLRTEKGPRIVDVAPPRVHEISDLIWMLWNHIPDPEYQSITLEVILEYFGEEQGTLFIKQALAAFLSVDVSFLDTSSFAQITEKIESEKVRVYYRNELTPEHLLEFLVSKKALSSVNKSFEHLEEVLLPTMISMGGNSLLTGKDVGGVDPRDPDDFEKIKQVQKQRVKETLRKMLQALTHGGIITHGNGPEAGVLLERRKQDDQSFDEIVAQLADVVKETQEWIALDIKEALKELAEENGISLPEIEFITTHVAVDPDDPGFRNPTKPVGIKPEDSPDDRPRVASPRPLKIIELDAIKEAVKKGKIVICVGGGGIPVNGKTYEKTGKLEYLPAVIDKDFATVQLTKELGERAPPVVVTTSRLVISTGVPAVYINFGKPDQQALTLVTPEDLEEYIAQGQFAAGSMLPKVEAAMDAIRSGTAEEVIITDPEHIAQIDSGALCTRIVSAEKKQELSVSEKPEQVQLSDILDMDFFSFVERYSAPGEAIFSDSRLFLVSNEKKGLDAIPVLREPENRGGAYIGTSLEQNFSYIAAAEPEIGIVLDYNRYVTEIVLPVVGELIARSTSRLEYLAVLFGKNFEEEIVADSMEWDLRQLLAYLEKQEDNRHHDVFASLVTEKLPESHQERALSFWLDKDELRAKNLSTEDVKKHWLGKDSTIPENSWLKTRKGFQKIQNYWNEGRIKAVSGDWKGKTPEQITALLRSVGVQASVIYISNLIDYFKKTGDFEAVANRITGLNVSDHCIVLSRPEPGVSVIEPLDATWSTLALTHVKGYGGPIYLAEDMVRIFLYRLAARALYDTPEHDAWRERMYEDVENEVKRIARMTVLLEDVLPLETIIRQRLDAALLKGQSSRIYSYAVELYSKELVRQRQKQSDRFLDKNLSFSSIEENEIHEALVSAFSKGKVLAITDADIDALADKDFDQARITPQELIDTIAENIIPFVGDEKEKAREYLTYELVSAPDASNRFVEILGYLSRLNQARSSDGGYRYVVPLTNGTVFDELYVLGHAGSLRKSLQKDLPTLYLSETMLKFAEEHEDGLKAVFDHERSDLREGRHRWRGGEEISLRIYWASLMRKKAAAAEGTRAVLGDLVARYGVFLKEGTTLSDIPQDFIDEVNAFTGYVHTLKKSPSLNLSFPGWSRNMLMFPNIGIPQKDVLVKTLWDPVLGLLVYSINPAGEILVYNVSRAQEVTRTDKGKTNQMVASYYPQGTDVLQIIEEEKQLLQTGYYENKKQFEALFLRYAQAVGTGEELSVDLIQDLKAFEGWTFPYPDSATKTITPVSGLGIEFMGLPASRENSTLKIHVDDILGVVFYAEAPNKRITVYDPAKFIDHYRSLQNGEKIPKKGLKSKLLYHQERGLASYLRKRSVELTSESKSREILLAQLVLDYLDYIKTGQELADIPQSLKERIESFEAYDVFLERTQHYSFHLRPDQTPKVRFYNREIFNGLYHVELVWDDVLGLILWMQKEGHPGYAYSVNGLQDQFPLEEKESYYGAIIGKDTEIQNAIHTARYDVESGNYDRKILFRKIVKSMQVYLRNKEPLSEITRKMIEAFPGISLVTSQKDGKISLTPIPGAELKLGNATPKTRYTLRLFYSDELGSFIYIVSDDGQGILYDLGEYISKSAYPSGKPLQAEKIVEVSAVDVDAYIKGEEGREKILTWKKKHELRELLNESMISQRLGKFETAAFFEKIRAFGVLRGNLGKNGLFSLSPVMYNDIIFGGIGTPGEAFIAYPYYSPDFGLLLCFKVGSVVKVYSLDSYSKGYKAPIGSKRTVFQALKLGEGVSAKDVLALAKKNRVLEGKSKRPEFDALIVAYLSYNSMIRKQKKDFKKKIEAFGELPFVTDNDGDKTFSSVANNQLVFSRAGEPNSLRVLRLHMNADDKLVIEIASPHNGIGKTYSIENYLKADPAKEKKFYAGKPDNVQPEETPVQDAVQIDSAAGLIKHRLLEIIGKTGFPTVWDYLRDLAERPVITEKDAAEVSSLYEKLYAYHKYHQRRRYNEDSLPEVDAIIKTLAIEVERLRLFLASPADFRQTFRFGKYGEVTIREGARMKIPPLVFTNPQSTLLVDGEVIDDFDSWAFLDARLSISFMYNRKENDFGFLVGDQIDSLYLSIGDEQFSLREMYGIFGSRQRIPGLFENGFNRGFEGWEEIARWKEKSLRSLKKGRMRSQAAKNVADRGITEAAIHDALTRSFNAGKVLAVSDKNLEKLAEGWFRVDRISPADLISMILKNIIEITGGEKAEARKYFKELLLTGPDAKEHFSEMLKYCKRLYESSGESRGYRYVIPLSEGDVFDNLYVYGHAGKLKQTLGKRKPTIYLPESAVKYGAGLTEGLQSLLDHERADLRENRHQWRGAEKETINKFRGIIKARRTKELFDAAGVVYFDAMQKKTEDGIPEEVLQDVLSFDGYILNVNQSRSTKLRLGNLLHIQFNHIGKQGDRVIGKFWWDQELGLFVFFTSPDDSITVYNLQEALDNALAGKKGPMILAPKLEGDGKDLDTYIESERKRQAINFDENKKRFNTLIRDICAAYVPGAVVSLPEKLIENLESFQGWKTQAAGEEGRGLIYTTPVPGNFLNIFVKVPGEYTVRPFYKEGVGPFIAVSNAAGTIRIYDPNRYMSLAAKAPLEGIPVNFVDEVHGTTLDDYISSDEGANKLTSWAYFREIDELISRFALLKNKGQEVPDELVARIKALQDKQIPIQLNYEGNIMRFPYPNRNLHFLVKGKPYSWQAMSISWDDEKGMLYELVVDGKTRLYSLDSYCSRLKEGDRDFRKVINADLLGKDHTKQEILDVAQKNDLPDAASEERKQAFFKIINAYAKWRRSSNTQLPNSLIKAAQGFEGYVFETNTSGDKELYPISGNRLKFTLEIPESWYRASFFVDSDQQRILVVVEDPYTGIGSLRNIDGYERAQIGGKVTVGARMEPLGKVTKLLYGHDISRAVASKNAAKEITYKALQILGQTGYLTAWDYLRFLITKPVLTDKDLQTVRIVDNELTQLVESFIPRNAGNKRVQEVIARIKQEQKRLNLFLSSPAEFRRIFTLGEYGELSIRKGTSIQAPRSLDALGLRDLLNGVIIQDFDTWDSLEGRLDYKLFLDDETENDAAWSGSFTDKIFIRYAGGFLSLQDLYEIFGSKTILFDQNNNTLVTGYKKGFEGLSEIRSAKNLADDSIEEEDIHKALVSTFTQGKILAISDADLDELVDRNFDPALITPHELIQRITSNIIEFIGFERIRAKEFLREKLVLAPDAPKNYAEILANLAFLNRVRSNAGSYRYVVPLSDDEAFNSLKVLGHAGRLHKSFQRDQPTFYLSRTILEHGQGLEDGIRAILDHERWDLLEDRHRWRGNEQELIYRTWGILQARRSLKPLPELFDEKEIRLTNLKNGKEVLLSKEYTDEGIAYSVYVDGVRLLPLAGPGEENLLLYFNEKSVMLALIDLGKSEEVDGVGLTIFNWIALIAEQEKKKLAGSHTWNPKVIKLWSKVSDFVFDKELLRTMGMGYFLIGDETDEVQIEYVAHMQSVDEGDKPEPLYLAQGGKKVSTDSEKITYSEHPALPVDTLLEDIELLPNGRITLKGKEIGRFLGYKVITKRFSNLTPKPLTLEDLPSQPARISRQEIKQLVGDVRSFIEENKEVFWDEGLHMTTCLGHAVEVQRRLQQKGIVSRLRYYLRGPLYHVWVETEDGWLIDAYTTSPEGGSRLMRSKDALPEYRGDDVFFLEEKNCMRMQEDRLRWNKIALELTLLSRPLIRHRLELEHLVDIIEEDPEGYRLEKETTIIAMLSKIGIAQGDPSQIVLNLGSGKHPIEKGTYHTVNVDQYVYPIVRDLPGCEFFQDNFLDPDFKEKLKTELAFRGTPHAKISAAVLYNMWSFLLIYAQIPKTVVIDDLVWRSYLVKVLQTFMSLVVDEGGYLVFFDDDRLVANNLSIPPAEQIALIMKSSFKDLFSEIHEFRDKDGRFMGVAFKRRQGEPVQVSTVLDSLRTYMSSGNKKMLTSLFVGLLNSADQDIAEWCAVVRTFLDGNTFYKQILADTIFDALAICNPQRKEEILSSIANVYPDLHESLVKEEEYWQHYLETMDQFPRSKTKETTTITIDQSTEEITFSTEENTESILMEEQLAELLAHRKGTISTRTVSGVLSALNISEVQRKIRQSDPFYAETALQRISEKTQTRADKEGSTLTLIDFDLVEHDDGNEINKVLRSIGDGTKVVFFSYKSEEEMRFYLNYIVGLDEEISNKLDFVSYENREKQVDEYLVETVMKEHQVKDFSRIRFLGEIANRRAGLYGDFVKERHNDGLVSLFGTDINTFAQLIFYILYADSLDSIEEYLKSTGFSEEQIALMIPEEGVIPPVPTTRDYMQEMQRLQTSRHLFEIAA